MPASKQCAVRVSLARYSLMPDVSPSAAGAGETPLTRTHLRRLRQYYRSAGWPCHDNIEIDLLQVGLVRREMTAGGTPGLEAIVVTDTGIAALARFLEMNRRAHAEHDVLVDR